MVKGFSMSLSIISTKYMDDILGMCPLFLLIVIDKLQVLVSSKNNKLLLWSTSVAFDSMRKYFPKTTTWSSNGATTKYNTGLVAKGYSRVHGLDYNETLAPIARMDSIRLVFTIATLKKWELHHMDVNISFIHGDLEDEIYMRQPEGCTECSSLFAN